MISGIRDVAFELAVLLTSDGYSVSFEDVNIGPGDGEDIGCGDARGVNEGLDNGKKDELSCGIRDDQRAFHCLCCEHYCDGSKKEFNCKLDDVDRDDIVVLFRDSKGALIIGDDETEESSKNGKKGRTLFIRRNTIMK